MVTFMVIMMVVTMVTLVDKLDGTSCAAVSLVPLPYP